VLFEFVDIRAPTTIQTSIWQVDPKVPGFAYCMVDYHFNIRANSRSKAPFNLWPYSLKFALMRPVLIYRSLIHRDDTIETLRFPGRDSPALFSVTPLEQYNRSRNLTIQKAKNLAKRLKVAGRLPSSKSSALAAIQSYIDQQGLTAEAVADTLSMSLYESEIRRYLKALPNPLKKTAARIRSRAR